MRENQNGDAQLICLQWTCKLMPKSHWIVIAQMQIRQSWAVYKQAVWRTGEFVFEEGELYIHTI